MTLIGDMLFRSSQMTCNIKARYLPRKRSYATCLVVRCYIGFRALVRHKCNPVQGHQLTRGVSPDKRCIVLLTSQIQAQALKEWVAFQGEVNVTIWC